jgi:bifunctional non-homologous end joining protein LigD
MSVKVMLCQTAEPFSDDNFLFEPKLDGVRAVAFTGQVSKPRNPVGDRSFLDRPTVIQGRNMNDITLKFPEISLCGLDAILDGEIVCLANGGVPSFERIQQRIHKENSLQIRYMSKIYPATYFVFDILQLNGSNLKSLPLAQRKNILSSLDLSPMGNVRTIPYIIGEGVKMFEAVREKGFEGVVAKQLRSPYLEGSRSPLWRKIKARREGVFLVCGATKGKGSREGLIGSLILGEETSNGLRFVGEVGSGLTMEMVQRLTKALPLTQGDCPFAQKSKIEGFWFWVKPQLRAEVEYFEWTSVDNKLRHPSLKRLKA